MSVSNVSHGLDSSVHCLRGVGPKIGKILEDRGIVSVEDLFYLLPVRYENRTCVTSIKEVVEGKENVVVGKVVRSAVSYPRSFRKRTCTVLVEDDSGTMIVKWFHYNQTWMATLRKKGTILFLSGKVTRYGSELQMVHPAVTVVEEGDTSTGLGSVIPIYPEIEGIKQGTFRNLVGAAFKEYGTAIASLVPAEIEVNHGLPGLIEAMTACHSPDVDTLQSRILHNYRTRMITEEFFLFQIALLLRKKEATRGGGIVLTAGRHHADLISNLSFTLTSGQQAVMAEIERDMARREPMNRLLQGDVGCGKTICAILAAAIAVDSGYQAVFMAPTEILAEQHYLTIHRMFEEVGVSPVLVRGGMGTRRRRVLEGLAEDNSPIIVGTHALLHEDVQFQRLGLIVIDEQHRFGVVQRSLLREKGLSPDMLVMSATPIPRTLSMVIYGDLDVSIIEDMPLFRQKITTEVVTQDKRAHVYEMVRQHIQRGRQAFIVYPILEESQRPDLLSAKKDFVRLRRSVFPEFRIGLLHGKMSVEEKEKVMWAFKGGAIDILVCTTVIEVGIDIPNATTVVVEHAERFGLSQLHQLRGRVGRGRDLSRCYLICTRETTAAATRRLRILEETADGFVIAEEDMKLRGQGDVLGARQAGIPRFRLGDVVGHGNLMVRARQMAERALTAADSTEERRLAAAVAKRWGEKLHLGDVL